ncbi:MAG: hypothetical protein GX557_12285 [Chloroflexi bacterium]|nr:hypothetical protein [Chloroflexota bacterium]
MPQPDLVLGERARSKTLSGFEAIGRLAAISLGPIGGTICYQVDPSARGTPEIVRDAGTAARRVIQIADRVEDVGAMIMRHTIWQMKDEIGDGAAMCAVLAMAIAREMHHLMAAGANPMVLRKGVDKAIRVATQEIDRMAQPLEGEKRIAAVATAASGSPEIGKLLGEMFDVLGPQANIVIEPYTSTYHDRAYREGTVFKGGYISPYLANDTLRRMSVLNDVHVAILDMDFKTTESVEHVLNTVAAAGGKNLLLVCRTMGDKGITMLATNNERGTLKSCAVKLVDVGELRQNILTNMSLLTGAEFISDKVGQGYQTLTPKSLGYAARVTATRDKFTIIGGRSDKEAMRKRSQELRAILKRTPHPTDREHLRKVIDQLSDGVGELRIGALTELDRKAQTEIAEVAIRTVKAGIEGGIVAGGGAAYLDCVPAVLAIEAEPGDERFGV